MELSTTEYKRCDVVKAVGRCDEVGGRAAVALSEVAAGAHEMHEVIGGVHAFDGRAEGLGLLHVGLHDVDVRTPRPAGNSLRAMGVRAAMYNSSLEPAAAREVLATLHDGRLDLLVGSGDGRVRLYRGLEPIAVTCGGDGSFGPCPRPWL
mgnify:CR=1 FL=1